MLAPQEIERRSFEIIDAEADRSGFGDAEWAVARRMIHTAGDVSLAAEIIIHKGAVAAGMKALREGVMIFTDTRMAAAGISATRLVPANSGYREHPARSLFEQEGLEEYALAHRLTLSAAAMECAAERLAGGIVVIGNAPTALERLLDLIKGGMPPPALIIGIPVGFVGAVESKERLVAEAPVPYVTVKGRRGGSNLAAAAVNALAVLVHT